MSVRLTIRATHIALLVAACLATTGALAAPARAGTYTVRACHSDGINNSWQTYRYNGYADAYVECPGGALIGGRVTEGMIARNTGGAGTAPFFSHARVFFDAPPGARIVRMTGQIRQNSSGGWQAGIHDETMNRWLWCGPGCLSTFGNWVTFDLIGLSTQRVAALAMCAAGGGCARDGLHAIAAVRDVTVTVADDTPPNVAIRGGSLVAGGWRRGVQDVVVDASDAAGVRDVLATVDGAPAYEISRRCDYTRAAPCANGADTLLLDTRTVADGPHQLSLVATDPAGNRYAASRTISVDNTPPSRPLGMSLDGGSGWRARNSFQLKWTNPRDTAAPIDGASVAVCPIATGSQSMDGCTVTTRSGRGITSARDLRAPGAGRWRARVWLRDAAGNTSAANNSEIVLELDDQSPTLTFLPLDDDHPARVRVSAGDAGSGIATREILLRRIGTATWMSLPVTVDRTGFSAFVDDEVLADGIYELRARVTDYANNERSTDRRSDGAVAQIELPLRIKTRLVVGRPKRVRARGARGKRYRVILLERPRTSFGRTIPLRGRLTSPGGNPLAGRDVQVLTQTRIVGAPWRLVATVRTDHQGRFTFNALRGPSRTLRFRFAGTDTIRGRTAEVRLSVRAASGIGVNDHSVVNGEDVTFRGRLRGKPLSSAGKLVELQARARGRWITFATTRARGRWGRWSYRYRFSGTRGSVRYRFRARIPYEAGYPYATGVTKTVAVRVRGL